ncbi:MAG: hypothetical protein JOZ08_24310 [Verrucomicrobia bacterium]|nr:hypothetical protein [Verrucomicrobiota bacterium]
MSERSQTVRAPQAQRIVFDIAVKAISAVGRHPALFLLLPSLYLLLVYPPIWKDVDALGQLIWQAGWGNILHYPPLYCFTGRIPFWLADSIQALLSGQPLPGLHLFSEQHPTWLGIEFLIIAQHAGLITALTVLVRTAARSQLSRGAITISCIAASSLYAQQQCAGSEAPSVSAIILLTAAGLWLYRSSSSRLRWIVFTIALFAAFGTRHINYLFVLWLPLVMIGHLLWSLWQRRRILTPELAKLGLAVACGGFALLADTLIVRVLIAQAGEEYRTDLGFVLSDRVTAFLYKLSDSERAALVEKLVAAEPDPIIQAAIRAESKVGSSHAELASTIQDALRQEGIAENVIQVRGDVSVFYAALAYLRTLHPKLIDLVLSDFLHGYVREDNSKLSLNRFLANRTAARMRKEDPQSWLPLDQLHSIDDQKTASALVTRASTDPYLMLWGPIPIAVMVLVNLGLTIFLIRRRQGEIGWLAQALLLTGAILYFANCICDYFNDRYTLPLLVCALAAFAVQVGALLDGQGKVSS